ncbi:B3 domain-containing protein [Camellia lanceoleosa]|uniref:B3 domain-containing protein n=1 Tax=Camellia lanceoleosa TaxID=1840588 RepID=A0ACC0FET6_9ERIC|nr:B3 domain-containing protein [Camellia lanceoleosa]
MREHIKRSKNKSSVIVPVDQISEVEATMTKKPTKIRRKLKPPDQSFVSKPARFSVDRDYGDEIRKMVQKSEKVCSKQPRHEGDYSDDEEKGTIKKRRMIEKVYVVPPELPAEFKNHIERLNGIELNFVIEKQLYKTDLSHTHGRLSLPLSQIDDGFLTQEEKDLLNTRIRNHKTPIEAQLIEPSGQESDICLKKWDMPKKLSKVSTTYNLTTSWNRVVKNNRLREGMIAQLWSFRVGSKLWFALVKVKRI